MIIGLSIYGCDDNTKSLGVGMFPPGDKIEVDGKIYKSTSESVESGSIFAKTDQFYIGKYLDEDFGDYEASFLTQFNCTDSLQFPKLYDGTIEGPDKGLMAGDSIIQTEIIFNYSSVFGDTIAPVNIRVYKLNKQLRTDYYTDIDAEEFYDEQDVLSEATYSAVGLKPQVNANPNAPQEPKQSFIRFILDKEVGTELYRKNRSNPEYFYNNKAFTDNVFPGIYAKTVDSSGSVVYLDNVTLNIKFNIHALDSLGQKLLKKGTEVDSVRIANMTFASTREVVQANKLLSDKNTILNKIAEKSHTYVKAPSGIFTQISLPVLEMIDDPIKQNDTIINVNMTFQSYNNEQGKSSFKFKKPLSLGLFKKKEYEEFFEKNKVFDFNNNFYTKLNQVGEYKFSNIERLIVILKKEFKEAETEAKKAAGDNWNREEWKNQWVLDNPDWNKILLVPVDVVETKDQQGRVIGVSSVRHNIRPEMTKLIGGTIEAGGKQIDLRVVFTKYDDKNANN